MENKYRFNWRIFFLAGILVIGAAIFLTGCGSSNAPTPTATAEATAVPTPTPSPTPETFMDKWKSSPHAKESAEAFRHWDNANPPEIPVTCAKCHSRPGFLDFLGVDGTAAGVVDSPAKTGTVITCYVCHNEATYTLDSVTFTSGEWVGGLGPSARCVTCHQGRGSTGMVNDDIEKAKAAAEDMQDTPNASITFVNSHSTAAATVFGSEVHGAYEYAGKTYHARFSRGDEFFPCIRCHDQHSLKVKTETCGDCHTFDGSDTKNIRVNTTDFDGDKDISEGTYYEVEHMKYKLLEAIQTYARDTVKAPIAYDLSLYPYFFNDNNGNGKVDPEELKAANAYKSWTPRLLKAAYNYNYSMHDTAAYAHNSTYILQVLYDSLEGIGWNMIGMTRP